MRNISVYRKKAEMLPLFSLNGEYQMNKILILVIFFAYFEETLGMYANGAYAGSFLTHY